jgi:hypothetical protein
MPFDAAHVRVEAAFAAVRHEAFLGPGPWPILHSRRHVATPDDDPVYLYQDLLVGFVPERRLNNGRPFVTPAKSGDPGLALGSRPPGFPLSRE